MEDAARELVHRAPKCEHCTDRIASNVFEDEFSARKLCEMCCVEHVYAAAISLCGEPEPLVADLPEGKHALEVAKAYNFRWAL